jgi:AraC-like DNA-binding protein
MYITHMAKGLQNLLGVEIVSCSRRVKVRTAFDKAPSSSAVPGIIQLMYITGGRARFELPEGAGTARAGDAVVLEMGSRHERLPMPERPLSFFMVLFIPVSVRGRMDAKELGLPHFCRPRNPDSFAAELTAATRCFMKRETDWRQRCSILGIKILSQLVPATLTGYLDPTGPDLRRAEKRIGDVLDYIHINYKKRLLVEDLARMVNMHPMHLTRLFKQLTGVTPHRYVLEKKIGKAKDFLRYYNESLTTTAEELGFHDYSHFCRVFTRLAGVTPGQFLKKSR